MLARRTIAARSNLASLGIRRLADDAAAKEASTVRNPLLALGAGLATAVAGYTVFCYTQDTASSEQQRREEQRRRSQQLTKDLGQRYSIVGHTERPAANAPPRGITGSDFERRRILAAGDVGDNREDPVWRHEFVDVSIGNRDRAHAPAGGDPGAAGKTWRDENMNVALHEQEVRDPSTHDTLERTDRLDAESGAPPQWIQDKNSAFLHGFRLTSRQHGNEESNTAASPGEVKRDIGQLTPDEKDRRVYAKKEDITKADNLGLDGGAKASRDGQAMMDHAKRIASLP